MKEGGKVNNKQSDKGYLSQVDVIKNLEVNGMCKRCEEKDENYLLALVLY